MTAADVAAYIAAVTAHPAFTERFADELATPGIRVPLTAETSLWHEAVTVGREVVWAATYGQACAAPRGRTARGHHRLRSRRPAASQEPHPHRQGATRHDHLHRLSWGGTVHAGQGTFGPVTPRMWGYDVAGANILRKWFSYRKANPGGKRTSPLDAIHLAAWPREWITEFNEPLTALRRITDLGPAQADLLDRVLAGPLLSRRCVR